MLGEYGRAVAAVEMAFEHLHAIDLSGLDNDGLTSAVMSAIQLQRRADAFSAMMQQRAKGVAVLLNGKRCSVTDVAAERSGMNPRASAQATRLAAWMQGFPAIDAAFRQGKISQQHAAVIRQADNEQIRHALFADQSTLVAEAQRRNWKSFTRYVNYFVHRHDPDGERASRVRSERCLSFTEHADGTISGRFRLDPISGQTVRNALEYEQQRLLKRDEGDGEHESSQDPGGDNRGNDGHRGRQSTTAENRPEGNMESGAVGIRADAGRERSRGQRLADALVGLLRTGHQHQTANPQPLVHIVLSQNVAEATIRRLSDANSPAPILDSDDVDGRCELQDGTAIHPTAAIAELAVATLQRVVFSTSGVVLELGRKTRSFPRELAQAIRTQHRAQCAHPNCDSPVAWLESDHVAAWANGGTTGVANGQPLCGAHNRAKADAA